MLAVEARVASHWVYAPFLVLLGTGLIAALFATLRHLRRRSRMRAVARALGQGRSDTLSPLPRREPERPR